MFWEKHIIWLQEEPPPPTLLFTSGQSDLQGHVYSDTSSIYPSQLLPESIIQLFADFFFSELVTSMKWNANHLRNSKSTLQKWILNISSRNTSSHWSPNNDDLAKVHLSWYVLWFFSVIIVYKRHPRLFTSRHLGQDPLSANIPGFKANAGICIIFKMTFSRYN